VVKYEEAFFTYVASQTAVTTIEGTVHDPSTAVQTLAFGKSD